MQKFREIILHIGLPKTATTTLQSQLVGRESDFLKHDLAVYAPPEFSGNGTALCLAILDSPRWDDGARIDPQVLGHFEQFAKQSQASRLLLSSERLSYEDVAAWRRLAAHFKKWLLPGARVRILLTVRHPESWMKSRRNQREKSGDPWSWDNPFPALKIHTADVLTAAWGLPCKLDIKRFEDLKFNGIWEGFVDWIGLPPADCPAIGQTPLNSSISMESRWVMNEMGAEARKSIQLSHQIQNVAGIPDGLTPEESKRCWLPSSPGADINAILESEGLAPYRPSKSGVGLKDMDLFNRHCIRSWKNLILTLKPEDQMRIQQATRSLSRQPHMHATSVSTRFRFGIFRLWMAWKQKQ